MLCFAWSDELDPAVAAGVRQVLEQAKAVDGVAPIGEPGRFALNGAVGYEHLVAYDGSEVVAYANIAYSRTGHEPTSEMVVAPGDRRRGIGSRLIAEVIAHGGPQIRLWAHGGLPAARAAAKDLVVVRELLQLGRPLDREFEVGDVEIRSYRGPADDSELLRVNNAAFSWHPEQGGWTRTDLESRMSTDWFNPAGLLIAPASDGRMRGFHWTKRHPGDAVGEVYIVGVDPAEQGSGLGRALTAAGLNYLRENGATDVILYVESNNAAALAVYGKLGFTVRLTDVAYTTPDGN